MPIDAEQWRVRTGLFNASRVPLPSSSCHRKWKLKIDANTLHLSVKFSLAVLLTAFKTGVCLAFQTLKLLSAAFQTPRLLSSSARLSCKGLIMRGVSVLLAACLVVVPMLLIISGDVEENPGPPKKTTAQVPELRDLAALPISDWRSLGLRLGLQNHMLDRIQANNAHDPRHTLQCTNSMFDTWLRVSRDPSCTELVEALVAVGEDAVAKELCTKYGLTVPDICIPSRLPECLRQYAEHLRGKYKNLSIFPKGEWPPSIGNHYIRLSLIEHKEKLPSKESSREISEDFILGHVDRIVAKKKTVQISDIFNPPVDEDGKQLPLKVLIDGAPGVGKTTLCHKVSKDWAENKLLTDYYLVVLLQLRRRGVARAKTISDLFYYCDPVLQEKLVSTIVQSHGEGVLVLLDGFDELSHEQRANSIFSDLISGDLLPKCSVMVTSRPYASECLQELPCIQRHVEVCGFNEYNIRDCIMKNIPDPQKAKELVKIVGDRQDIAYFCYIPLNCAILMYVYQMENYSLPSRLTQLFTLFIMNALKRHARHANICGRLKSLSALPLPMQHVFNDLCKLAFNGLANEQLMFEDADLQELPSLAGENRVVEEAQLLGLMTTSKSFTSMGEEVSYQFLHLTIQEFLAALWITKLSPDQQVSFLKQNLLYDRFYVAAIFAAGLSQFKDLDQAAVFNQEIILPSEVINKQDRSVLQSFLFLTHLAYESDNPNLCIALASAVREKTITLNNIKVGLFNWMTLGYFMLRSGCRWTLNIGQCRFEDEYIEELKVVSLECSKQTGSVEVLKIFTESTVSQQNLSTSTTLMLIPDVLLFKGCKHIVLHRPLDWLPAGPSSHHIMLGNLLNMKMLTHLEVTDFPDAGGTLDAFSSLGEALADNTILEVLCIKKCKPFTGSAMQAIAAGLANNTALKSLTLSGLNIKGCDAVHIFKALQQNHCLESLDLSSNRRLLDDDHELLLEIGRTLRGNKTLNVLDLQTCSSFIGNILISILAFLIDKHSMISLKQLKFDSCTWTQTGLRSLTLNDLKISHDAAFSSLEVLAANPMLMVLCIIKCDHFKGSVMQAIAAGLANNTALRSLTLSDLKIKDCDAAFSSLGEALAANTILEVLCIKSCDPFTGSAVHTIAAGLANNTALKSLTLSGLKIKGCDAVHIFKALQQNHCLESLDLSSNRRLLDDDHELLLEIVRTLRGNKTLNVLDLQTCSSCIGNMVISILEFLSSPCSVVSLQRLEINGFTWTPSVHINMAPFHSADVYLGEGTTAYRFLMSFQRDPHHYHQLLRHLYFSSSPISKWVCKTIVGEILKLSSIIEVLNLSHCDLTDYHIKYIAQGLQKSTSLTHLDISHNKITEDGAKCIAEVLEKHTSLKCLCMGHNCIGDGVTCIAQALRKNVVLKTLELQDIPLMYIAIVLASVQLNTCLETLDLGGFVVEYTMFPSEQNLMHMYLITPEVVQTVDRLSNNFSLTRLMLPKCYLGNISSDHINRHRKAKHLPELHITYS